MTQEPQVIPWREHECIPAEINLASICVAWVPAIGWRGNQNPRDSVVRSLMRESKFLGRVAGRTEGAPDGRQPIYRGPESQRGRGALLDLARDEGPRHPLLEVGAGRFRAEHARPIPCRRCLPEEWCPCLELRARQEAWTIAFPKREAPWAETLFSSWRRATGRAGDAGAWLGLPTPLVPSGIRSPRRLGTERSPGALRAVAGQIQRQRIPDQKFGFQSILVGLVRGNSGLAQPEGWLKRREKASERPPPGGRRRWQKAPCFGLVRRINLRKARLKLSREAPQSALECQCGLVQYKRGCSLAFLLKICIP